MSGHYDILIKFNDSSVFKNKINWRLLVELFKNAQIIYDKIIHIEIEDRECNCDFISHERGDDSLYTCDEDCYFNDDETGLKLDIITRLPNGLKYLDIEGCKKLFKNIELPNTLEYLNINNCEYDEFPFTNISRNLLYLNIINNNIKEIPELPDTLNILYCDNNNNLKLPDIKHCQLKELSCGKSNLKELPELPDTIEKLNIKDNKIKKINKLPKQLKEFICSYNSIYEFPEFPNTLEELECVKCKLVTLPKLEHLSNLNTLNIDCNDLLRIPKLPTSIKILFCGRNKLTDLPDLPLDIEHYNFKDNNIKKMSKMMALFAKYKLTRDKERFYHFSKNMIRLYTPNYTNINRSIHKNVNVDDDNFVYLFNMFDENPLIYTMMQYRDNLDNFYEEEFVNVDKLMEYYKQDPTNLSAYYSAVKRIENWFLECKFNPDYGYCQRRVQNEFNESFSNLN